MSDYNEYGDGFLDITAFGVVMMEEQQIFLSVALRRDLMVDLVEQPVFRINSRRPKAQYLSVCGRRECYMFGVLAGVRKLGKAGTGLLCKMF